MTDQQKARTMRRLFDKLKLWGCDWPTVRIFYPGVVAALDRLKAMPTIED